MTEDASKANAIAAKHSGDIVNPAQSLGCVKPLDPLFNEAFIRIFGSKESKNMTGRFVDCILEAAGLGPIGEVESISAEHTGIDGSVSCRSARFDVKIVKQNTIVDLEAQRRVTPVADRSTFYASRIMSTAVETSTAFDDLPQVVVVTLYDAPSVFPQSKEIIAVHRPMWHVGDDAYPGSDRIIFVLVELGKFRQRYNDLNEEVLNDELVAWLYLLTNGYGNKEEVKAMEEAFPTIEEFALQYGFATGDPKLVQAYQDYGDAVREERTFKRIIAKEAREKGLAEGRARGRAEGRAEGRADMIARMREHGMSEDEIIAIAG